MQGTVKFFNRTKGFGFIVGEDGVDYFVHQSALPEGVRINDNQKVTFDVEQSDRGPKAVNVKLDNGSDSEAPAHDTSEQAEESNESDSTGDDFDDDE